MTYLFDDNVSFRRVATLESILDALREKQAVSELSDRDVLEQTITEAELVSMTPTDMGV